MTADDGRDSLFNGNIFVNRFPVPSGGTFTALTYTFYDSYQWLTGFGNPFSATRSTGYDSHLLTADNSTYPYPQAVTQSSLVHGLITGTAVKNLANDSLLYTINFYDDKGRIIQVQSKNITGDTGIVTTQYSFTGQPLLVINKLGKGGANAQTTVAVTKLSYDDLGRVTKTEKKLSNTLVNGGSMSGWVTTAEMNYDALGQLKKKILAPTGGGLLDSLTYDYNIRGWLLGANRLYTKDTTSTVNYFGFDLGYDKTAFTINGTSKSYTAPQHNGNIGGMLWKKHGRRPGA